MRRPPRSRSWWFSPSPERCAPTQNSAVSSAPTSSAAPSSVSPGSGSGRPVAPTVVARRRWMRSASAASRPSDQAGPTSVTPAGSPSGPTPAGTAIAAKSHRLTKLVNVPSRLFGPIGSAAHSCNEGQNGAVGTSSASTSRNICSASRRAAATACKASKVSTAVRPRPDCRIAHVTGCSRSGPASANARNAAVRSATHGPS